MTNTAMVASDITPQNRREPDSIALVGRVIKMIITGIMPAMTAFIDIHSGTTDKRGANM